jgi:hypothetical protein
MGVSTPTYSEAELAELRRIENEPRYFEGKPYTQYEASQKQRRYETEIRRQKDLLNLYKGLGDKEAALLIQARINRLNESYASFSKATGLAVKTDRISVPRLGGANAPGQQFWGKG